MDDGTIGARSSEKLKEDALPFGRGSDGDKQKAQTTISRSPGFSMMN